MIFLPDEYLSRYVASQTHVEVILWKGHCEVHERFTAAEVLAEADFVGSTSGMIRHVEQMRPRRVVMVTECSMGDNVAVELPARRARTETWGGSSVPPRPAQSLRLRLGGRQLVGLAL